jgi:DNA-binding NarL/FixJ family response regulator
MANCVRRQCVTRCGRTFNLRYQPSLSNSSRGRGPYAGARAHPLGLTQREPEVLGLVARGLGNKEIARRLVRSTWTIENHVSAVLSKLHAANRMDVVLRLRSEPWLLSPAERPPVRETSVAISRKLSARPDVERPRAA